MKQAALNHAACDQATPSCCLWLGIGACWSKHDRGICRVHELFALPRLVFVWPYGVYTRCWCVGAAALLGRAYDLCAAAAGSAGVTARWQMPNCSTKTNFVERGGAILKAYGSASRDFLSKFIKTQNAGHQYRIQRLSTHIQDSSFYVLRLPLFVLVARTHISARKY